MTKNKTCLPKSTDQLSGGHYQTFKKLVNIKTTNGDYAETNLIDGKTGTLNRPSTVIAKKFQAKIPTGADITKIVVTYKHSKADYNGKSPNITAPKISLYNGNKVLKYGTGEPMTHKGQAPTNTPTTDSTTFNSAWDYNVINSDDFNVRIDYPTNANNNSGYVRLYYVQVKIYYTEANFGLNWQLIQGQYNHDDYTLDLTCSNSNKVRYIPTVTIDAPAGFSIKSYEGDGELVTVSARTYTWTPALSLRNGSNNIRLTLNANVTYSGGSTSYTGTFNAVESLQEHDAPYNVTVIKDRPVDPTVDPDPEQEEHPSYDSDTTDLTQLQYATRTEPFTFVIHLTNEQYSVIEEYGYALTYCQPNDCSAYCNEEWVSMSRWGHIYSNDYAEPDNIHFDADKSATLLLKSNTIGIHTLGIYKPNDTENPILELRYMVNPKESDLTTPSCSVLSLSQEEINRLGDGYVYTLQTYLKENTTEDYVRNWYKNFRLGVFNNAIESNVRNITYVDDEGETQEITYDSTDYDNLTINDIVGNAQFWSDCPTEPNTYTNLECEFRYNKQYPLYILIVGDYSEASTPASITYAEPEIIETQYYQAPTKNGIYPQPIDDLTINDGSTSEITIPPLSTSDTIIFYNLPLTDNYGTDTNNAIRGFQINGKIEQNTDNLILYASLVNSKNQSKQRSIILDETTITENKTFHIGQPGDLWGFNTLDMINLEDWEVHLTLSNLLINETATCNFGDINLTLYHETVEHQNSKCYIEREDLSYYGVFLTDVKIPEGLKTDTSFLNIKGTDTNDPYRQNIKEKTIEVEFTIGDNCDLEEATLSLRQLTKLLVNERDKYNRPIPKRIEFSHYPDVYWEYIMEETLDSEIEISSYNVKAKLVIPAGTSYDKKTTHTNTTGYISGLAHIRPNIQFIPTASTITISETVSQQEFNMGYTDWTGKIVEIDCDNRIVWLLENEGDSNPVNITGYVDYNSDWFILFGEYNFTGTGCLVKSVDWQQRW